MTSKSSVTMNTICCFKEEMTHPTQDNVSVNQSSTKVSPMGVDFIVFSTLNSFFCLLGILGNILVLFVYMKGKDSAAARIYTLFLAFVDLFTCSASMSLIPVQIAGLMSDLENSLYMKSWLWWCFLSVLILLAVAVDRYYAVYKPIAFKRDRKKRTLKSILAIIPASLFFGFGKDLRVPDKIHFSLIAFTLGTCFLAVTLIYIAVFVKLYKRSRIQSLLHVHSTVGSLQGSSVLDGRSHIGAPDPPTERAEAAPTMSE